MSMLWRSFRQPYPIKHVPSHGLQEAGKDEWAAMRIMPMAPAPWDTDRISATQLWRSPR